MPHVSVKLYPGRSEQQKAQLAQAIVKDVTAIMNCGADSVFGRYRRRDAGRLGREGLRTGHHWPGQQTLQKTRLRPVEVIPRVSP